MPHPAATALNFYWPRQGAAFLLTELYLINTKVGPGTGTNGRTGTFGVITGYFRINRVTYVVISQARNIAAP